MRVGKGDRCHKTLLWGCTFFHLSPCLTFIHIIESVSTFTSWWPLYEVSWSPGHLYEWKIILTYFFCILHGFITSSLATPTWEAQFHGWRKCSQLNSHIIRFLPPSPQEKQGSSWTSTSSNRHNYLVKKKKKSYIFHKNSHKKKRRERNVYLMWYSCLWTLLKSRSNLTLKWALSTLLFHLLSLSSYCCLKTFLEQSFYISFWGWSTWFSLLSVYKEVCYIFRF